METHYQVAVIGGGINGVGIARESIAQGYTTLLVEKDDFSHATSSQTSKMIHGGIRYLEQAQFALVRESMMERKILLNTAPHLVKPLRIRIPIYRDSLRPAWMVQAGCKLYDWFAGSQNLSPSRGLSRQEMQKLHGLRQDGLKKVISYSDGQVLDSRLCLETALSAESYGASVYNYMKLHEIEQQDRGFHLLLVDQRTGQEHEVSVDILINVTGPWAPQLEELALGKPSYWKLEHVRGIHFVVKSIGHSSGFLILPQDGRVVFVLPWQQDYTLIGTTESLYQGNDFDHVPASEEEKDYLLEVYNSYFPECPISFDDVLHVYSGVRPLVKSNDSNMSKISREYKIHTELSPSGHGYIGVYGGKLTTYRSLGEHVVSEFQDSLNPKLESRYQTRTDPLFGGAHLPDVEPNVSESLSCEVIERLKSYYGSQWAEVAAYCVRSKEAQESIIDSRLLRGEVQYLVEVEKAYTVEDILLRRTKLGYIATDEQKQKLQECLSMY